MEYTTDGCFNCLQGMSELPDFKKIEFPDMPPIPLEDVIPDASPEVSLNMLL